MPNAKSPDQRKDYKATLKITRQGGKFIESLSHQLYRRGKTKRERNKNAAMQACIDYTKAGKDEFGWDEVIDE